MDVTKEPDRRVLIDYTNYRGERAMRTIMPKSIRFGVSGWHTVPQWLLAAHDCDKGEDREFAVADIHLWVDGEARKIEVATGGNV